MRIIREKYLEIRNKYYNDLDDKNVDKIVLSDPTTIIKNGEISKMGIYSKWLINLYKQGNLKLEDLYKAKNYLEKFNILKNKNLIENKDIFKYKSLNDLYDIIKSHEKQTTINTKGEVYKRTLVFESDKLKAYIPKTYKESIALGRNTQWCTSYDGKENMFKYYKELGDLIIVIDEEHGKLQFHSFTDQYMDKDDWLFDIHSYLDHRHKFKKWYKKYMSTELLEHYFLPTQNSYDIKVIHKLVGGSDDFYKILNEPKVYKMFKEIVSPEMLIEDHYLLSIDSKFIKDLEESANNIINLEGFLYVLSELECFNLPIVRDYLDYCIDKADDIELMKDLTNMKLGKLDYDKYTGVHKEL